MKAILMITALLMSASAFAENVRAQFKYEYHQAQEIRRCARDANYCKIQQELNQLYNEQYHVDVQLRAVKNTPNLDQAPTMIRLLTNKLQYINDRILELKVESNELAARID